MIIDTPFQRPEKWVFGVEGDIVIAQDPFKSNTKLNVQVGTNGLEPSAIHPHVITSSEVNNNFQDKEFQKNRLKKKVPIIAVATGIVIAVLILGDYNFSKGPPGVIPVGTSPSSVAVNPSTNVVYVANRGDNSISVIHNK